MKSLISVYGLVGVLALGIWLEIGIPVQANFSGVWILDKEKTPNLPPQLESYTMIVTQNDRELTVETKVVGDFRPGGGPGRRPGGGFPGDRPGAGVPSRRPGVGQFPGGEPGRFPGGRGGVFGMMPAVTYRLDGKETTMRVSEGLPGTVTLKAKWKNDGQVLELTTIRSLTTPQGDDMTLTTKERWSLAENGKVLKVRRTTETPMGAQESELIFNKE